MRPYVLSSSGSLRKQRAAMLAVKGQAYTAKAIRSMGAHKIPHLVKEWFGDNDEWTRSRVLGVLNGVNRLLSNVDYIFPGERCTENKFAYVFPKPPWNKNKRGRYVFHLCQLYMNSKESDQIETLTHEASHHETMFSQDAARYQSCFLGSRAKPKLPRYLPIAGGWVLTSPWPQNPINCSATRFCQTQGTYAVLGIVMSDDFMKQVIMGLVDVHDDPRRALMAARTKIAINHMGEEHARSWLNSSRTRRPTMLTTTASSSTMLRKWRDDAELMTHSHKNIFIF